MASITLEGYYSVIPSFPFLPVKSSKKRNHRGEIFQGISGEGAEVLPLRKKQQA
jgi:hypothetical protein